MISIGTKDPITNAMEPATEREVVPNDSLSEIRAAILRDYQAIDLMYERGELDRYAGRYVAVFEERVVAESEDGSIRNRAAELTGVDADRFAVTFVEPW